MFVSQITLCQGRDCNSNFINMVVVIQILCDLIQFSSLRFDIRKLSCHKFGTAISGLKKFSSFVDVFIFILMQKPFIK